MSQTRQLNRGVTVRFLVITARGYSWISALRSSIAHVQIVNDAQETEDTLSANQFDIILYDDATFEVSAMETVKELRLQNPNALIAIISDNLTTDYYNTLMEAGAWDAFASDYSNAMMLQRINALMRQSKRNREIGYRTRRLHAINLLTQKLHGAVHPKLMIVDAIELVCSYFDVYAVAITIHTSDIYQLFAGTYDGRRRIYETKVDMHPENPLRQVMDSDMSLIFPDVKKHPYFRAIPIIKNPESSLIVPIKQGTQVIGSLALFGQGNPYTIQDVAVFELLASNFGSAYINVREQHRREVDVQSMRYLLQAWPELNAVFTKQNIVQVVHEHIQGIESVKAIGIWLFPQSDDAEPVIYSGYDPLQERIMDLHRNGHIETVASEFDEGVMTRIYNRDITELTILDPLFDVLSTEQLILIPIAGNSFEGVIIASSQMAKMSSADLAVAENLARVVANVLERNTLIESIQNERVKLQEQTGRIEGVLRSIDEGIFFVDEDHQIVYSNPQFTELTNIAPSQVMNQPFSNLFSLVSKISPEQQLVYEQLMQAAKQIEGQSVEDAYPFVEIETLNQNNLVIEFMRVDTVSEQRGWIGVIGIQEQRVPQSSVEHFSKLQNLVEDMTTPIMELSNSTLTLPQQYDMLSHGNFEALLQRLEGDVRQMQSMWGNFVQIYKGEVEGIALRPTAIEPSTFVENALSNRRMALYQRQIHFEPNTTDVEVYIDERQMRQCFINIIEFLAGLSKPNAPIFAELMTEGTQVIITLQEKTTILAPDAINNIFNPKRDTDNKDDLFPYRLGMYFAQQIVQAHNGQLMVNNARGSGLMIRLALPLMGEEDTFIPIIDDSELTLPVEAAKDKSNYRQSAKGLTITIVESRSKFMQGVYPKMEVEGHDLIPEARLDGALFDLKMTKVDLVILEIDRYSPDVVGQVQKIRSQYEVPIVIIALEEYEEDCLSALSQGADDYFLMPLNEEKLIAQLQAISKRLELAARTAEPIKVGGLEIDFSRRRVYLDGKLIDLTAKEYELLRVLVMNRGQVMSHKALLAKVWGPEHDNETQYLWVNISRLRRKLEPKKDSPRYIQNEPRVGYVFATDM